MSELPRIIQGGMGIGVSGWRLARAVSMKGQLGVVSGTALDVVFARTLQLGDPGAHLRRALNAFPYPSIARDVLGRFFIPGGKRLLAPFKPTGIPSLSTSTDLRNLIIAANFASVYLAKEGHSQPVGINLLEKIQLPTLFSLYGAMLAGVDVVLMGAGIPRQIPGILDAFAKGEASELKIDLTGEPEHVRFDPALLGAPTFPLQRPKFFAIVSSPVLADSLLRKASGHIDGFVVETPQAGGHNAPPRGPLKLDETGQPLYGSRDAIDPAKFQTLGRPFWLAGGYGRPGKLAEALALGASGIQAGTAFAFCEESDIEPGIKQRVLEKISNGSIRVHTDPQASPTGFPFKIVQLEGSLSDPLAYQQRQRICDIGLLRQAYRRNSGQVGFRCPSEPERIHLQKDGEANNLSGKQCLCNGLLATIGLGQIRQDGTEELPLLTAGDDLPLLKSFMPDGRDSYTAADVIDQLLQGV